MNIALILAGGSGHRMKQDIPKQFLHVNDIPVIVYTLRAFQRHELIDAIAVVCLDGWHDVLRAYANQFNITKLKWITSGGQTGQESIRNGILFLKDQVKEDDLVVIHDGIRPLVDVSVLTDVILTCKEHGNAVTAMPYNEQIFRIQDEHTTRAYIPREQIRRVSTPQAYTYGKLLWAYEKAFAEGIGIHGSSYANTMMVDLGETLYFAKGSDRNIKLTTKDDLELFKAYLALEENDWLK